MHKHLRYDEQCPNKALAGSTEILWVIRPLNRRDHLYSRDLDNGRIRKTDQRNDAVFELWKAIDGIAAARQPHTASGGCKEVPGHIDIVGARRDERWILSAVKGVDTHITPLRFTRDHFMGGATAGDAVQGKFSSFRTTSVRESTV